MKPPINPNQPHALGYLNDTRTHSLGIRPHPHNHQIAKDLLFGTRSTEDKPDDPRPLIDQIHEGTFGDPVGLQWIEDKYTLRSLLRKAHRFTVDDATSKLVADFSVAITHDLEGSRQLAIPPFDVTWIDINNRLRLERMKELGFHLTSRASGELEGPPVERVGWLIHPATDLTGGWYVQYVCATGAGVMVAPLAYWWHAGIRQKQYGESGARPGFTPYSDDDDTSKFIQSLTFGIAASAINVLPYDAYPCPTPMHKRLEGRYRDVVRDLMTEIAGELRHVWGLLVAINSTQFGVTPKMGTQALHTDIRKMPNGKPLLPLEHKTLHLHLRQKVKPEKVVLQAITHHKVRNHDVRGHLRTLRNKDGSVRKLVHVRPHERGDKALGRIEKTYVVEK